MIELMIEVFIAVGLFVLGAALGSFAAASVWRLRATQLTVDKTRGEPIEQAELVEVKNLTGQKRTVANDRSVCLHCGRQLKGYDMIPVVSWLALRGRCRTCKKAIGKMEIGAELMLGFSFVVSYLVWPYEFSTQGSVYFVLWLIMLVLLAIHWMYDAKWFLLLDKITLGILLVAFLYYALRLAELPNDMLLGALLSTLYVVAILPGFYGLLYLISKGTWIGFGDVKLLVPFALMLPTWEYGVLLIFLANLIGCLVLLPLMVTKRVGRMTRVPFGPFLILAFIITFLFGRSILDFYIGTILF